LLALLHAGEAKHPAVARGVRFLLETRTPNDHWEEKEFTGTGFPRAFFLRYHGYSKFFPLWALALYRRAVAGEEEARRGTVTRLRHSETRR